MSRYHLCNQSEINENQTRSFSIELDEATLNLFIIKYEGTIKAYLNNCPHLDIPLNWQPDKFLSLEGTHIQCSTHGALFEPEDGDCIAGPCRGEHLTALDVEIQQDGEVFLLQHE